jgi:hypothetical protein
MLMKFWINISPNLLFKKRSPSKNILEKQYRYLISDYIAYMMWYNSFLILLYCGYQKAYPLNELIKHFILK